MTPEPVNPAETDAVENATADNATDDHACDKCLPADKPEKVFSWFRLLLWLVVIGVAGYEFRGTNNDLFASHYYVPFIAAILAGAFIMPPVEMSAHRVQFGHVLDDLARVTIALAVALLVGTATVSIFFS
jgi:hypothetical protein